jgi:hypothetical protein
MDVKRLNVPETVSSNLRFVPEMKTIILDNSHVIIITFQNLILDTIQWFMRGSYPLVNVKVVIVIVVTNIRMVKIYKGVDDEDQQIMATLCKYK